jgi:hypothetical protein
LEQPAHHYDNCGAATCCCGPAQVNIQQIAPRRKLGVVILVNRGKQHATGIGRQICTPSLKISQSHQTRESQTRDKE